MCVSFTFSPAFVFHGAFPFAEFVANVHLRQESLSGDVLSSFTDTGHTQEEIYFKAQATKQHCENRTVSLQVSISPNNFIKYAHLKNVCLHSGFSDHKCVHYFCRFRISNLYICKQSNLKACIILSP